MHTKAREIKKIGFYDSGLGGLFLMSHVWKKFPNYDYVFLGDEKNLPYGSKTDEELVACAQKCFDFLLKVHKVDVLIIACNTLSATVYEALVSTYTQTYREVLFFDVISPTIDSLNEDTHFIVFGTPRTIQSHIYQREIQTLFPKSEVTEIETRELASLIESGGDVETYLAKIKKQIPQLEATCILGCTHYGIVLDIFKKVFPQLHTFVKQHTIIRNTMMFILNDRGGETQDAHFVSIYSTCTSQLLNNYTKAWFGKDATVKEISL